MLEVVRSQSRDVSTSGSGFESSSDPFPSLSPVVVNEDPNRFGLVHVGLDLGHEPGLNIYPDLLLIFRVTGPLSFVLVAKN